MSTINNKNQKPTLSTASSTTTLVNYGQKAEIIPLKDTFNASSSDLKGADSPIIYKELLSRQLSNTSVSTTVIQTGSDEDEKKEIEVPILRGPECPKTYARYFN